MAKKKRGLKPKVPQTPPLEDLLRVGEAVLYGQVCWSIANRGTERPRPGEVSGRSQSGGSPGKTGRDTGTT